MYICLIYFYRQDKWCTVTQYIYIMPEHSLLDDLIYHKLKNQNYWQSNRHAASAPAVLSSRCKRWRIRLLGCTVCCKWLVTVSGWYQVPRPSCVWSILFDRGSHWLGKSENWFDQGKVGELCWWSGKILYQPCFFSSCVICYIFQSMFDCCLFG